MDVRLEGKRRGSFSRDNERYCGPGRDTADTESCLVLVLEEEEELEPTVQPS